MDYSIVPIAEKHISGFRAAVDVVARERRFLAFLEAPPLEETTKFVLKNIEQKNPQFVVLSEGKVVGWCDVLAIRGGSCSRIAALLGLDFYPNFVAEGSGGSSCKGRSTLPGNAE
jgi:hypothetical protein